MIPYLLDHSKTLTALVNDNTAGLGALAECTKATVTEERNGEFSLSIQYPITGVHFKDIEVGGLIKAKPNETAALQIFRIKKISKPLRGIVTITANHISYDLGKTSVAPFSSIGAAATMTALKNNMTGGSAFTLSTDIPNTVNTFTNTKPQSLRALLGGQTGSLLDVFGGEYEFNNTSVILHASRGSDSGIVLEYGKNITDIQQDENIENTYTAVMPYALDGSGNAIVGTLQTIIASAEPKILNLDLSEKYDIDETPTAETLNAYAQAYIAANDLATPSVSIKVSFVALWQTEEYKSIAPLERVRLCDTITVKFEKLGISATAKIISTEFDVLQERYNSIEVGDAKSTFASTISGIASSVQESATSTAGYLDGAISMFTSLIANGMGLFVTKEAVGTTGGVKFYLHNKPTRAESQYQWTINASGFAVSQDYGETWTAGIDASGNALFNSVAANEINAMKITGSTISGSEMGFFATVNSSTFFPP